MLAAGGSILGSSGWIGVLGIVVGLLSALGAAWAVLRSNLATATIELLKEQNDALKGRLDEVERDNAAKDLIIKNQSYRIDVLQDMVSGTKAVENLGARIDRYHKELMAAIHERPV